MHSQMVFLRLPYNLWRLIMLLVVASTGGGINLARAIAVCKDFSIFGDDEKILKIANFENFSLPESVTYFQQIKGLLVKCAEAGNNGARYILAQVILVSFSQLREPKLLRMGQVTQASTSRASEQNAVSAFFSYFRTKRRIGSNSNGSKFYHFELVRYFVSQCNFVDFVCMLPHVENYVKCFGSFLNQHGVVKLFEKFSYKLGIIEAVADVGKNRTFQIEPQMRNAREVFSRISESDITSNGLTPAKWEELKGECKYMAKELSIIKNIEEVIETCSQVPDMEERFFYYVAFDGPVTREIDLSSDHGLHDIWLECSQLAMSYEINRADAISAFDEIFRSVLS